MKGRNASLEIRAGFANAAIHFAAWDGNIKVIKMLYGHVADFNDPLGTRSRPWNSQNCLEQPVLREVHDVIPIHNAAALHVASYYGLKDLVGLLISYGASLGVQRDKRRYSSFHSACDNSHVEVVKLLLDSASNKSCGDINGTTPLHIACGKGLFPIAKLLLCEPPAAVYQADNNGYTALHIAAMNGSHRISRNSQVVIES
ncbi:unnamed protein product [Nezara viridula]|uniref:Uncharacterized protein n=1 Tax=Nezara viridula TaxID=85310 RepID=A0A9P0MGZ9_NEZVI|nr:unnamed protein product [Nezara viridula]